LRKPRNARSRSAIRQLTGAGQPVRRSSEPDPAPFLMNTCVVDGFGSGGAAGAGRGAGDWLGALVMAPLRLAEEGRETGADEADHADAESKLVQDVLPASVVLVPLDRREAVGEHL